LEQKENPTRVLLFQNKEGVLYMKREEVTLGRAVEVGCGTGKAIQLNDVNEKVIALEEKLNLILNMLIANGIGDRKEEQFVPPEEEEKINTNKDGLPVGMTLIASTKGQVFVLSVSVDAYFIGQKAFPSLSAAATAVRGSRVSGWTFWHLPDGRTVKEAFRR
jgi:hypothetical protein